MLETLISQSHLTLFVTWNVFSLTYVFPLSISVSTALSVATPTFWMSSSALLPFPFTLITEGSLLLHFTLFLYVALLGFTERYALLQSSAYCHLIISYPFESTSGVSAPFSKTLLFPKVTLSIWVNTVILSLTLWPLWSLPVITHFPSTFPVTVTLPFTHSTFAMESSELFHVTTSVVSSGKSW